MGDLQWDKFRPHLSALDIQSLGCHLLLGPGPFLGMSFHDSVPKDISGLQPVPVTKVTGPAPPHSESTYGLASMPRFFLSELSLLPGSLWAPATSSPTITTALATAAGKPCHPQSSCLHRRRWCQASQQRGKDPTHPSAASPLSCFCFLRTHLSSVSYVYCAARSFSSASS